MQPHKFPRNRAIAAPAQDAVGDAMEISIELWNVILKMLFILLVLTAIFLITHFGLHRLGRRKTIRTRELPIDVLFSRYLGTKKSISMVKIPGKILVLGITPDRITLLSEIEKTDQVESMCRDKPDSTFSNYLSLFQKLNLKFLPKGKEKPTGKKVI